MPSSSKLFSLQWQQLYHCGRQIHCAQWDGHGTFPWHIPVVPSFPMAPSSVLCVQNKRFLGVGSAHTDFPQSGDRSWSDSHWVRAWENPPWAFS